MNILRYTDNFVVADTVKTVVDLPQRTDIQRILIIKWGALGDMARSSAIFQDISLAFPNALIDLNTFSMYEKLFQHDPRFNKVFSVDIRGKDKGWAGMLRWLKQVRAGNYDVVIDLQSVDRSRMMLQLLQLTGKGIRYRVGHGPGLPYNITPPKLPAETHGFEYMRGALAAAGIPFNTVLPCLHVPPRNIQRAADLAQQHGLTPKKYVVFFPGCQAAGYLKRWGAARYAALGQLLQQAGVEKILVLGASDEAEECSEIARLNPSFTVNLCGQTEIFDLLPLCENALCIVGNDTGTAQMVTATGTPLLGLYGPTDPRLAKPVGPQVIALQVAIADMPCLNCHCKHPCSHQSCMKAITPERALQEISAMTGIGA
jgi:heptosyltransferase-2